MEDITLEDGNYGESSSLVRRGIVVEKVVVLLRLTFFLVLTSFLPHKTNQSNIKVIPVAFGNHVYTNKQL